MYGQPIYIGGLLVATLLVDIPTHVKMHWVGSPHCLLTHVLQLHMRQMHGGEVYKDLQLLEGEQKGEVDQTGVVISIILHTGKVIYTGLVVGNTSFILGHKGRVTANPLCSNEMFTFSVSPCICL